MPDIKTALQSALKTAPLALQPKPQMEQIWLWIRDHPDIGVARLKSNLSHLPQGNISSLVSQLLQRKMVTAKSVPSLSRKGHQTLQVYSVTSKTYEVLPYPADLKKRRKEQAPTRVKGADTPPKQGQETQPEAQKPQKAQQAVDLPTPQLAVAAQPAFASDDVSQWPVGKALAVYRELKKLFGDIE